MDELALVMTLETADYALVKWLNMCSKICLEVSNLDILEIGGNDMAREIVLEKQNLPILCLEFQIPLPYPFLIQLSSHPCLHIAPVIKA